MSISSLELEASLRLEAAKQKAEQEIERIGNIPLVQELKERLTHSADWSKYHKGTEHSEDVLEEAILYAVYDGVEDDEELEDIAFASLGHDIALTIDPDDPEFVPALPGHEQKSADFMREKMKKAGYSRERIQRVAESIEDTRLIPNDSGVLIQQKARHPLGRYLSDGDLSNLGREDFFEKSSLVWEELAGLGMKIDKGVFLQSTLGLISAHTWQTDAGLALRGNQQDKNINSLRTDLKVKG